MFDVQIEKTDAITEEEIENLQMLYKTPMGSIPLERDKGMDLSFLSMPLEVAKNMCTLEIIKRTRLYSNNLEATEVKCSANVDGRITAKVVIKRGE